MVWHACISSCFCTEKPHCPLGAAPQCLKWGDRGSTPAHTGNYCLPPRMVSITISHGLQSGLFSQFYITHINFVVGLALEPCLWTSPSPVRYSHPGTWDASSFFWPAARAQGFLQYKHMDMNISFSKQCRLMLLSLLSFWLVAALTHFHFPFGFHQAVSFLLPAFGCILVQELANGIVWLLIAWIKLFTGKCR